MYVCICFFGIDQHQLWHSNVLACVIFWERGNKKKGKRPEYLGARIVILPYHNTQSDYNNNSVEEDFFAVIIHHQMRIYIHILYMCMYVSVAMYACVRVSVVCVCARASKASPIFRAAWRVRLSVKRQAHTYTPIYTLTPKNTRI